MEQLHRRFTDEQIKLLIKGYEQGKMSGTEVQEMLGVGKTRFFALVRQYRHSDQNFSIRYERRTAPKMNPIMEARIREALLHEKRIVEDPDLPISGYNYTAIRDRLREQGIHVSVTTIIDRARKLSCHKPRKKKREHNREVLTESIGSLIQHDSSFHMWSPLSGLKWYLITSIDDYSRKLLYADFVEKETTWAHILAAQALIKQYGIPLRYYVDSFRIFRFVQGRDSVWRKHVLHTDDVNTQWAEMMNLIGVEVVHALSPQAKGKVERPYRWLQDRIVRTCIYENLATIDEARSVLKNEVNRYNNHQVHSTTGEIPETRFQQALKSGNSLFHTFTIPKPFTLSQDVFCLRTTRIVNAYRRISLFHHSIQIPAVPPHEEVLIHMIPDEQKNLMQVRFWWHDRLVHQVSLPLNDFRVHF